MLTELLTFFHIYVVGCPLFQFMEEVGSLIGMTSTLERQSSKRKVVGWNPDVGNNFSFCNSRFLRVANSSNQPVQMKSTVTYT